MSRSSKVRKFSCRVLDFRYIFLIFISRQNKFVCSERASKKNTRFDVPLRVHLLEIRRPGSWDTLPRRRSGIFSSSSYFPHDKCLYLQRECSAYRWILLHAASCGLLLVKEECRISSPYSRLLVLANVRRMVNLSLATGFMPNALKIASLSPTLKKPTADFKQFTNVRPISNLKFISKLVYF